MSYAATVVSVLPSVEVLSRKAPAWCLPNACLHRGSVLLPPTFPINPLKLLTQTGSKDDECVGPPEREANNPHSKVSRYPTAPLRRPTSIGIPAYSLSSASFLAVKGICLM